MCVVCVCVCCWQNTLHLLITNANVWFALDTSPSICENQWHARAPYVFAYVHHRHERQRQRQQQQ